MNEANEAQAQGPIYVCGVQADCCMGPLCWQSLLLVSCVGFYLLPFEFRGGRGAAPATGVSDVLSETVFPKNSNYVEGWLVLYEISMPTFFTLRLASFFQKLQLSLKVSRHENFN